MKTAVRMILRMIIHNKKNQTNACICTRGQNLFWITIYGHKLDYIMAQR